MIEGRVPSQVEQNYLRMKYEDIGEQIFISMFVLDCRGKVSDEWIKRHEEILKRQKEAALMFGFNPQVFEEHARGILKIPETPKVP